MFTATTDKYAENLAKSTWTNAKASYTGKIVTVTPTDCTKPVSANIKDTTGHEKIVVTFGEVAPISVTGIALDKSELSLSEGDRATLTATVTPSDATNQNVTWTSDNTAVATVSDAGLVTAIAVGTANITVTTEDGAYTATCAVTVSTATDYSAVYTSNVTISGSKVKIGNIEYDAIQVGVLRNSGSKSFTVPANTTRLCLHVVGWKGEGGKKHAIAISKGSISSSSITTTEDSGASGISPFTLSNTDYSGSDYYYTFSLSGVTEEATVTISNSAKSSRAVYFGINAE